MAMTQELAAKIRKLEDIEEIKSLQATYAFLIDRACYAL